MKIVSVFLFMLSSFNSWGDNSVEIKLTATGRGSVLRYDVSSCLIPFTGGRAQARELAKQEAIDIATSLCERKNGIPLSAMIRSTECSCYDSPYQTVVRMEYTCSAKAVVTCSIDR